MKDKEIRRNQLLYDNQLAFVQVYEGELISTGQPVAIKDQRFSSLSEAMLAVNEALSQVRLSHPSIAQFYGLCMSKQTDGVTVSLIIELCTRDLKQEIEERYIRNDYWSEEELWQILINLVNALALAQEKGLSHRDIKPHNLFLDTQCSIKLGDFGSSKYSLSPLLDMHTIQGSPYFLSPALKQALIHGCRGPSKGVNHNLYKSDVYSLGLTWMYMAKLEPSLRLAKMEELKENTEREIESLLYSERFKETMRLMLRIEEDQRPDFQLLQAYLNSGASGLLAALNADIKADRLGALIATGKEICAHIKITLKCRYCQSVYTLDTSHGFDSEASLLFCSQSCLNRHIASSPPQVTSKTPPNITCVICEKRSADCSFLICKQCQDRQARRLAAFDCCVVCSKPRSRLSQLFHHSSLTLPCSHYVCSQACAKQALLSCPACAI